MKIVVWTLELLNIIANWMFTRHSYTCFLNIILFNFFNIPSKLLLLWSHFADDKSEAERDLQDLFQDHVVTWLIQDLTSWNMRRFGNSVSLPMMST